jgi:hypothetical protein
VVTCLVCDPALKAAGCCCCLLQASLGAEPSALNLLPIAVVGFAKRKLGINTKPVFKRFEDVLTLFKPVRRVRPGGGREVACRGLQ